MINKFTMQFVAFNSLEKLNSWLKKYTDLIYIESWQAAETSYTIQFHIKEGANVEDYEQTLNMLVSEANE